MTGSEIAAQASFDRIRYAQAWEDPRTLIDALAIEESTRVLSIAASGDNCFALLIAGAAHVDAVDLSPAQCALVELKRAAIITLSHSELVRFVGAAPAADRGALYARVRVELPDDARAFWDSHRELITAGVIHVGKLENMWRIFRTRVHPALHSARTIRDGFIPRTPSAREEFWHERWNTLRWRAGLRMFFSQFVIGKLGRDPAFFEHVSIEPSAHYGRRANHAFVALDPSQNPFLRYIMLGETMIGEHGAPWLDPAKFDLLRSRIDRLHVHCAALETFAQTQAAAGARYDAFNLSDIFEWMSDAHHARCYEQLLDVAADGARLAYWNNLVPRSAPATLAGRVTSDARRNEDLHYADRSFLYRAFHCDTVAPRAVAS